MPMISILQRIDRIARYRAGACGTAPARSGDGARARDARAEPPRLDFAHTPPPGAPSSTPIIGGLPLGEVHRGALWRAVRWDGHQTLLVGPGVTLTLCPSSVRGMHAALSEVLAARDGAAIANGEIIEGGQS